jgi:hypothetical protein
MFMERIADGIPAFSAQGEDLALVYRAQEGDTAAFAELVTKYRNRVFAQIYRMILNEEDALEISQKNVYQSLARNPQIRGQINLLHLALHDRHPRGDRINIQIQGGSREWSWRNSCDAGFLSGEWFTNSKMPGRSDREG